VDLRNWKLTETFARLRKKADPITWDEGKDLLRRGALEAIQLVKTDLYQLRLSDPREIRKFSVAVERATNGEVRVRCKCNHQILGICRHMVAAIEHMSAEQAKDPQGAPAKKPPLVPAPSRAPAQGAASPLPPYPPSPAAAEPPSTPAGSVLERFRGRGVEIPTRPDGSLLRVVLHSLGSSRPPHRVPHRVALQLFTGSGWTDVRLPDAARWIRRGTAGAHPRDAQLLACFSGDGAVRREVDSEALAYILTLLAGSEALVDPNSRPIPVSPWPLCLAARLVRAEDGGVAVRLLCRRRATSTSEGSGEEGELFRFEDVALVPSVAPWIRLEGGAFCPLAAGLPGPLLAELQEEDLTSVARVNLDWFLSEGIEGLERFCPGAVESEPGLIEDVEGVTGARLRLEGTPRRLSGRLELCFGGEWRPAPRTAEPWTSSFDGKVRRYPPAGQALARARADLEAIGFRSESGTWIMERDDALATALTPRSRPFVAIEPTRELSAFSLVGRRPTLQLRATSVSPSGGPGTGSSRRGAEPGARAAPGTLRTGSGIAWLEVSFELRDGERILPIDLGALWAARARNPGGTHQLVDGTVLSLRDPNIESLIDLASAAGIGSASSARTGSPPGSFRVPLGRLGDLLDETPGRSTVFEGQIRSLADCLRGGPAPEPVPLDSARAGILRPYQKDAVRWFGALAAWGLGGILADEMGLGKTLMALAHFFGRKQNAEAGGAGELPVLVVCPTSLIFNWIEECRKFFPSVQPVGLHGESPEVREEVLRGGADLFVTSYALLRRDREVLESREFRAVILDEGQQIKNPESQTARAARALRARERWALTGTPVENRPLDLWSLIEFVLPGLLGPARQFQREYAEPIARGEAGAARKIHARVRPFLLRRTKAQVLQDLPPRIEQVERAPLSDLQRALYKAQLDAARGELEGADPERSRFEVLAALTRLRQICCHPRLLPEDLLPPALLAPGGVDDEPSGGGKFDLLIELLDECIEEGHRVLLYSQFTSMLDIIEGRLRELEVPRCRLDGSTRDREEVVKRFAEDPEIPVFLISLKAGGLGLNLTQADTVILYDPWWNPAAEEQAAARAHRIGQTLPVHVHRIVAAGTVEEKILELQEHKREIAERLVGGSAEPLEALGAEELRRLLFED